MGILGCENRIVKVSMFVCFYFYVVESKSAQSRQSESISNISMVTDIHSRQKPTTLTVFQITLLYLNVKHSGFNTTLSPCLQFGKRQHLSDTEGSGKWLLSEHCLASKGRPWLFWPCRSSWKHSQ